jgi:glutathione S-transferase
MALYPLTALVTLLICLLLLATGAHVGRARTRYRIKAPAMVGHALFERAYRIQMNTLENAVVAIPALWLQAAFLSDRSAAACGAAWLLARIWYAVAYQRNPDKRGVAFILSLAAVVCMWVGAAWGMARVALA